MSHPKSKKVWYCQSINHTIMASYCNNNCNLTNWENQSCPMGNKFNDCKIISENNKKDIDKALK